MTALPIVEMNPGPDVPKHKKPIKVNVADQQAWLDKGWVLAEGATPKMAPEPSNPRKADLDFNKVKVGLLREVADGLELDISECGNKKQLVAYFESLKLEDPEIYSTLLRDVSATLEMD